MQKKQISFNQYPGILDMSERKQKDVIQDKQSKIGFLDLNENKKKPIQLNEDDYQKNTFPKQINFDSQENIFDELKQRNVLIKPIVIHFGYLQEIPLNFSSYFINYGLILKNGQSLWNKTTSTYQVNQINKNRILEIPEFIVINGLAREDILLYLEVNGEIYNQKQKFSSVWSLHRLFDDQFKLQLGKFILPLYWMNFDPKLLINKQDLPYISKTCFLHIKIAEYNDPVLDNQMIYHSLEYNLDQNFHSKNFDKDLAEQQQISIEKDLAKYFYFSKIDTESSFLWNHDLVDLEKNKKIVNLNQ